MKNYLDMDAQLNAELTLVMSTLAAAMVAAQDKAMASSEDCLHQLQIGWKPGKAVCALCRQVVDNPNGVAVRVTGVEV